MAACCIHYLYDFFYRVPKNLGFLRRNLSSCSQDVKEMAYKGLVRPILEYFSPVWDPHGIVVQEELEKVQNRAARFVTGNYNFETGSMTSILEQLGWKLFTRDAKVVNSYCYSKV